MNKKLVAVPLIAIVMTALLVGIFAATSNQVSLSGQDVNTSGNIILCDDDYLLFGFDTCNVGSTDDQPSNFAENLAVIRNVPGTRVTYADSSRYQNTPTNSLPINTLAGPQQSSPNKHSLGQFRTRCGFSHLAYDDPILLPGRPGASHLHSFYGNTETNAFSTNDTTIDKGGSTCHGGELNRTGYWVPSMLDGKGNVRIADYITVYYKAGVQSEANQLTNYPRGLQQITGDAGSSGPNNIAARWKCATTRTASSGPTTITIPRCASNENLYGTIEFQRCWNGVDLWKNDRSHLRYSNAFPNKNGTCPSDYKLLPRLVVFLHFNQHDGNTNNWYLASDVNRDGSVRSNGGSLHADWWNGWNPETNAVWNNRCNKDGFSVVSLLCNGRELSDPQGHDFTRLNVWEQQSGAKLSIPGSDIVKLCPGKQVPSNPAMLAWCQ